MVISGSILGGQISYTFQVDNYPGFPEGISGPELSERFRLQAIKFGAELIDKEASAVDFSSKPMKIYVKDDVFETKTVIVATGMVQRRLGLISEEKLLGRGVFVCATCDAILYEDKPVAVVGGGDSALQEAIDLSKYANEVNLIHRRPNFTANKHLVEKVSENPKIKILLNNILEEILGEKRVEAVFVKDLNTGERTRIHVDGVLIAIGWIPNTKIFEKKLQLDNEGYIISNGTKTGVEGVFVAGDVTDRIYRQVVTSCGSGVMAALDAIRYLESFKTG